MAMAAIPFRPYTGVIDTSSKRYQAAKAILDEGKATKSEAQSESETQLEKLRMLLRMLGKDTSSVDELLKLYEGDEETAIRNLSKAHRYPGSCPAGHVRHDPAGVHPLQRHGQWRVGPDRRLYPLSAERGKI